MGKKGHTERASKRPESDRSYQRDWYFKPSFILPGAILGSIYLIYIYLFFNATAGLDSDFANMVLYAEDVLSGNIFLSGWYMTGILFVTTDLPYFILGVLIAGVSGTALEIARILMFLAMIMTGFFLLEMKDKRITLLDTLIFFTFTAFPSKFFIYRSAIHTGAYVYVFLIFILLNRLLNGKVPENRIRTCLIFIGSGFALGVMGDAIILLTGTLPILILVGYDIVLNGIKTDSADRKIKQRVVLVAFIGSIAGMLLDKLYITIGGAERNSYLKGQRFISMDRLFEEILKYLRGIMGLLGADFSDDPLIRVGSLGYFLKCIFVVFGFYVIIKTLISFLRRQNNDFLGASISLGFIMISIVFICSSIGKDLNCSRYLIYSTVVFAVMIIRYLKERDYFAEQARNFKRLFMPVSCGILILLFMIANPVSFDPVIRKHSELGAFLEQNGLKSGYAMSFWDASVTTVYTNNRCKVRAMGISEDGIVKHKWFSKDNWYNSYADFILIRNDVISEEQKEMVVKATGNPQKRLEWEDYTILCYDFDLSSYVSP